MQACFQVATLTKNQDSAAGGGEDRDRLGSQQGLLSLHTRSAPACMLDTPITLEECPHFLVIPSFPQLIIQSSSIASRSFVFTTCYL